MNEKAGRIWIPWRDQILSLSLPFAGDEPQSIMIHPLGHQLKRLKASIAVMLGILSELSDAPSMHKTRTLSWSHRGIAFFQPPERPSLGNPCLTLSFSFSPSSFSLIV